MHFVNRSKFLLVPILALFVATFLINVNSASAKETKKLTEDDVHKRIVSCSENLSYAKNNDVEQSLIDCIHNVYFSCIDTNVSIIESAIECTNITLKVIKTLNRKIFIKLENLNQDDKAQESINTCSAIKIDPIPGYKDCELIIETAIFVDSLVALHKEKD